MLAGYRRFYLYSALSMAVLAAAIGIASVVTAVLHQLGVGAPGSARDTSRAISFAAAILLFAVPIGGAHLYFIVRSLSEKGEAASDVRHRFLNLWLFAAFIVSLWAGSALVSTLFGPFGGDAASLLAALLVAVTIGAITWWWIDRTPPRVSAWRTFGAHIAMFIAIAQATIALGRAASIAAQLLIGPAPEALGRPPASASELAASAFTFVYCFALWAIALFRQWPWRLDRGRAALYLAGFGIGAGLVVFAGSFEVGALLIYATESTASRELGSITAALPLLSAGIFLLVVHALLLRADRGRNGYAAHTTDRSMLAIASVVGLAALIGGASRGWRDMVGRGVRLDPEHWIAASFVVIGAVLYVTAWRTFLSLTEGDYRSAIRRFTLFTIVCLALAGTVVAGVLTVYNALTAVAGTGDVGAARSALEWLGPLLIAALTFAVHLVLLIRDQRRASANSPEPVSDSLLALMEQVRAGTVSPQDAAAQLRPR